MTTACGTAEGGENDTTNFVNLLHQKGVQTVVGFAGTTYFFYKANSLEVVTYCGAQKWMIEFTRLLGEGCNVQSAVDQAFQLTLSANIAVSEYTMEDFLSNKIPEEDLIVEVYSGLHTCQIVGNKSQIVKH